MQTRRRHGSVVMMGGDVECRRVRHDFPASYHDHPPISWWRHSRKRCVMCFSKRQGTVSCLMMAVLTAAAFLVMFALGTWAVGRRRFDLDSITVLSSQPQPVSARVVHLDLKGMPPKADYLVQLMPTLRDWGATGVLLEWEDMLPYFGELAMLRSPHAYTPEDVARVLHAADEAGLDVVPLVPTFARLEFLLQSRELSYLREVPHNIRAICPSRERATVLVSQLLAQVAQFHPHVRTMHLGGWHTHTVKLCEVCKLSPASEEDMYTTYLLQLVDFVRDRGLGVMMWDDMIRSFSSGSQRALAKGGVQLVVREAAPDMGKAVGRDTLRSGLWSHYQAKFGENGLWGASAYKCADRGDGDFVPLLRRLANHVGWLKLATKVPLRGIVLTGAARVEHLQPVCETIPAGLPAAALGLAVLSEGYHDQRLVNRTLYDRLGMSPRSPMKEGDPLPVTHVPPYTFPGAAVYRFAERLQAFHQLRGQQEHRGEGGRSMSEALGRAIHTLATDAEAVLPEVFHEADIEELVSLKLGMEIEEAAAIDVEALESPATSLRLRRQGPMLLIWTALIWGALLAVGLG